MAVRFERFCRTFYLAFEILTVMVMKKCVFWDIMPCSLLKINQHFGGAFWFLAWLTLNPEDEGDMSLQNCCWFPAEDMELYPRR
jgi:hypothetical protein